MKGSPAVFDTMIMKSESVGGWVRRKRASPVCPSSISSGSISTITREITKIDLTHAENCLHSYYQADFFACILHHRQSTGSGRSGICLINISMKINNTVMSENVDVVWV